VRILSSLMRTRENFPVGHPSQIAPSQARLTWRFFQDRLPKKKMHLVGMITILILLSLGPGHPIPGARISQAPIASSSQKCHAYIYDRNFSRNAHYNRSYDEFNSHAMFAFSSTFVHGRSKPRRNHVVHHVPRRVCNEPSTIYHACNTSFAIFCKNEKVVARKLGSKCKGDKTCIWVPKAIVTNLVGPNKSWVPKTQV
jgi:hypothetical protein